MALSQSIELIHLSRIGQGARTCILGLWLCMGCSLICITCIKSYYFVQTRMPWGLNANNQVHLHTQGVLNTYITTPMVVTRPSGAANLKLSTDLLSQTPPPHTPLPTGGGGTASLKVGTYCQTTALVFLALSTPQFSLTAPYFWGSELTTSQNHIFSMHNYIQQWSKAFHTMNAMYFTKESEKKQILQATLIRFSV